MDWLNILKRGLVLIASSLCVALLFALLNKYAIKPRKDHSVVKPSPIFAIIGIMGTIGFSFVAYLVICKKEEYLLIPTIPFILAGIWLTFCGIFWKITIEEDGIVFRNTFGKKRKYLYSEITGIIDGENGFSIRIGNKRIGVSIFNSNYSELRSILRKNCENELTHQRIVSKLSRKKRKQQKKQG